MSDDQQPTDDTRRGAGPASASNVGEASTTAGTTDGASGGASGGATESTKPRLTPSGTDATGGGSDTTTDYIDGEIRGG